MKQQYTKKLSYFSLFFLILLAVLTYGPGLNGPFLLDDTSTIPALKMVSLDWQHLLSLAFSQDTGPLHRPIASASFSLNYIFFGGETLSFKITNLILHFLNACLLYFLGKKILTISSKQYLSKDQITTIALISAVIWLIHPLNVSTVLYVVQRMTQLSTLFTLLAILSYIVGRQRILDKKKFSYSLIVTSYLVFGLLGLFSKENAALLPGYIFITEILLFKFNVASNNIYEQKKFTIFFSALILIPILTGIIIFVYNINFFLGGYSNRDFSLSERLLTETHVIWDYISQSLFPQISGMALHHDDYPITHSFDTSSLVAVCGMAASVAIALFIRKKYPVFIFGILWFLLSHFLESSMLPLEIKFEHRNYLAMYGLLLGATYMLFRMVSNTSAKPYLIVFFLIIIITFSFQTYERSRIWSDKEKLISYEIKYHPNSYRLISAQINENLNSRNFSGAREKTQKLRIIRPNSAGPALLDIILNCVESSFSKPQKTINSKRYIHEAITHINNMSNTGAIPSMLFSLSQLYSAKICKNISATQLSGIYNTALNNIRINERPKLKQQIMVALAQIYNTDGQTLTATRLLEAAHQLNPVNLAVLLKKGYIELNAGMLTAAEKTVAKLQTLNKTLPVYRRHIGKTNELADFIHQENKTQTP